MNPGQTVHKLFSNRALWLAITIALTLLWVDPTGLGHMSVGGDATRFGLGLMSELSRAARSFRVPLWNALWGYGFPALAESQLGVFYPPHLILYGSFPLEWAYAADRIVHAVWAACGCWILSRSLGRSAQASCLTALIFACSGFFLVHDTHHWAWPTTSWMPWIWSAMIRVMAARPAVAGNKYQRALVLSFCCAMPVLTGHFQMGFVAMVIGFILAAAWAICGAESDAAPISAAIKLRSLAALTLAVAFASALSAIQIIPTAELARIANDQRDWEYLSGFAAPPTHWLGLLLPGLGRRFPFWRPLLWDQFHTSPEELFFYVGLVPLWLAAVGMARSWRTEPATKALAWALAASLIFAAGPYLPGFSLAIRIPGFSFFRAPARWTSAVTLILALLAGRGLDAFATSNLPPVKSMRRFFGFALLLCVVSIMSLEGLIRLAEAPRRTESPILQGLDKLRSFSMPPWQDVGSWTDWVRRSASVPPASIPSYVKPYTNLQRQRFSSDRFAAYAEEAGPHLALLGAGFLSSFLIRGSRGRMLAVVTALMAADAAIVRSYRSAELAPVRAIRSQSPVLERLAEIAHDRAWPLAIAGDLGNLPMAVGSSPIRAYRTLDVPVMPQLEPALLNPIEAAKSGPLRLTGLGYLLIDPPTWQALRNSWRPALRLEEIDDPVLWSWLTTSAVAARGPSTFAIVHLPGDRGRAWRIDETVLDSLGIGGEPAEATRPDRLDILSRSAVALDVVRPRPESMTISARSERAELWIISQWADPNWKALLSEGAGEPAETPILAMSGGWQGIRIPRAGTWKLKLTYRPQSFRIGAAISGLAWFAALVALAVRGLNNWRTDTPEEPKHPEFSPNDPQNFETGIEP